MSKHTPTPWESLNQFLFAKGASVPIASGHQIYATDRGGPLYEEAKANAAFIVKAVNNHEALVRALEGALVVLESQPRPTAGLVSNDLQAAFDKRVAAVKAALVGVGRTRGSS